MKDSPNTLQIPRPTYGAICSIGTQTKRYHSGMTICYPNPDFTSICRRGREFREETHTYVNVMTRKSKKSSCHMVLEFCSCAKRSCSRLAFNQAKSNLKDKVFSHLSLSVCTGTLAKSGHKAEPISVYSSCKSATSYSMSAFHLLCEPGDDVADTAGHLHTFTRRRHN
jgi:hypothetical protein